MNLFLVKHSNYFFRWKGENVATNEVESTITEIIGLKEVVVYGVEVSITFMKNLGPSFYFT